ncbi:MAG: hypothetical protein IPO88_23780 [Nannocystis sp.]|uniref:hypothetical protein n=1 Tax=Nannocystis sp. TaxID=1962667 RepID=UPI002420A5DE|nr:hypothetical protein [Nannocystis sp.]MBK9756463.1 hypothetical protein [Nannocystis sp.]
MQALAPVAALVGGLGMAILVACGPAKPQTTDGSEASSSMGSPTGESVSGTSGGSTGAPTSTDTTSTDTTSSCDTACGSSDAGGGLDLHSGGGIECDIFAQDCAPGEKCAAWADEGVAWNATRCVPVTGDKVPGDVRMTEAGLSGIDNCEAGAMCWDVDAKNMGICFALCKGTAWVPTCDEGFSCSYASEGVLNLCLPECDPLVQDCAGDKLCVPTNVTFVCVPDVSGDMGKTNDACEFVGGCDKGLVCLNISAGSSACMKDAVGCCQPFCDFTAMELCPNFDQECVQWFDPMMPIPPGLEDVGVCAIPI